MSSVTKMNEVPGITGSRNNTILEFKYVSVNLEKKSPEKREKSKEAEVEWG